MSSSHERYDAARERLRGVHATPSGAVAEALAMVHRVLTGAADTGAADTSTAETSTAETSTAETSTVDGSDAGAAAAIDSADLLAALILLRHLREEIASWEPPLIEVARERGVSWAELATALGVQSRQAAERRYLRLRPSANERHTGEERVRAERTKRAGDRAVAAWARENSSPLRQLAGQVSALEGLAGAAQERADVLRRALGHDDVARLLSPLADMQSHLEDTHPTLAAQVKSVAKRTDELRRHTHEQRSPE